MTKALAYGFIFALQLLEFFGRTDKWTLLVCQHRLHLKNFDSLIEMEWFKAFYVYVNLEKWFQIFIFEKSDFFLFAQIAQLQKQQHIRP